MLDEQASTGDKHGFGYASMGQRRKRLAGAIACASLVCLGAGITAGVLIERSFHGSDQQAENGLNAASVAPSSSTDFSTATTNTTTISRPSIMLVGDVHTQFGSDVDGWATRLQSLYVRSVDVVNRGLAEFNTERFVETALPIISKELTTAFKPVLITVWFGTVDSALLDGPDALDHVRVERFYDNLVHILRTLRKQSPQSKLLVVSPPIVDDDARRVILARQGNSSGDAIDHTNNETATYATACGDAVSVLRDDNIAFLDLHADLMVAYGTPTVRAALFRDGLHFSTEGQRVVFEEMNRQIKKLLPVTTLETVQVPTPNVPAMGH